ncbi:unnamed protein product [Rotaria socialis]|uniref:Transposase n=3 Tax=Rotaria socialis TaxID=392032 RepID=A0A820LIQ4_9BILA|nr:unnamed protein product [Rotaria socialis]CAF3430411.1 unnamed protein product [Rotaria socialis]CAF4357886.1 unnamed protein product [Rotaria socialis]CAF4451276.1 unnamed protein product [Rotaria socialis]
MKKVPSRWIPQQLNDEQNQERVRLCRENLANFVMVPGDYVILLQVMRRGFTIGRFITSQQTKVGLTKPVVKEIRKQRKSNGTKGIKLLRDNASSHRHSDVINYLTGEGINIIPHPPYSPDLAPCDYWLNDYIKQNLTDQPDEKSLTHAVSKLIKNIPEEEFKKTFDKLLERMELCINNHGDYFEHLIK